MITCKCKHEFLEIIGSQLSLLKHYFTCVLCIIEYIIYVISYGHLKNFSTLLYVWYFRVFTGILNSTRHDKLSTVFNHLYKYFISQLLLRTKNSLKVQHFVSVNYLSLYNFKIVHKAWTKLVKNVLFDLIQFHQVLFDEDLIYVIKVI